MSEPRYYDPETGEATRAAHKPSPHGRGSDYSPSELARLQRERDEALATIKSLNDRHEVASMLFRAVVSERDEALSTLATLRAELRQARRRERVVAIIWGEGSLAQQACIKRCVNSSLDVSGDLDAAWDALHAAGLVEDEDERL